MATAANGNDPKLPSRAASLQRMLEIERKQKMERMQLNPPAPAPGRRGVSPRGVSPRSASPRGASPNPQSSLSNSRPTTLNRRRDTSVPRTSQQDSRRLTTIHDFTLPPLSIHSKPPPRLSFAPDRPTRLSEVRILPPEDSNYSTTSPTFDRDSLPSMARAKAAADLAPPTLSLKTVAFAPSEDGEESDSSSICHSPTWDDYGKKRRKDTDQRRKRLTKERPPAAMDNRPIINPRAVSDTVLSNPPRRPSLDNVSSGQRASSQTDIPPVPPLPLQVKHARSQSQTPGNEAVDGAKTTTFIGGVRLERELEAAKTRLQIARSSMERPHSEVSLHAKDSDLAKKRETMAAVPYPPTSSKTPYLKQQQSHARPRSGSFGSSIISSAVKLFNKDSDSPSGSEQSFFKRSPSQESVNTIQSLFSSRRSSQDRGRKLSDSGSEHGRAQSHDAHERRRSGINLPPLAWKNKRRERTNSMIASPPDSARDESFPPPDAPGMKQDNFSFLERPFSPTLDGPLSPTDSIATSTMSKTTASGPPSSHRRPVSHQPKKTFREAIKSGLRSSMVPDIRSGRHRSGTNDTLVGIDLESSYAPNGTARQSQNTVASSLEINTAASATRNVRQSQNSTGMNTTVQSRNPKDSGASSSSSHPDSDSQSQPPSPATTPDTSRPQSSKDNQTFSIADLRKAVYPHDGSGRAPGTAGSMEKPPGSAFSFRLDSSRTMETNVNGGSSRDAVKARFAEDLPGQRFLTDEVWNAGKKPLDPDQLSFTSALTSLDVKTSFTDLNATLHRTNTDVEPMSLDKDPRPSRLVKQQTAHSKQPYDSKVSSPISPHPAVPSRFSARPGSTLVPSNDNLLSESSDTYFQPPKQASVYLHEARKAAPSSPRVSTSKPGSSGSNTSVTSINTGGPARALALSSPGVSMPSPLGNSNPTEHPLMNKPIAKMLVECCHCRFYQDMPSRVYEAMARPNDTVQDTRLGVSGQVTTCVKCPWCSHNMSTQCCAGYAAVVYLREKLHGP